ncbi:MAG: polysaccharide biosynthesis/export family protein, partial [Methylotenera sp.]
MKQLKLLLLSIMVWSLTGLTQAGELVTDKTLADKTATDVTVAEVTTNGVNAQQQAADDADQFEYRIGALDLLEIKVLGADEMNRSVRVDSRGNINLPLIGMVKASGLTGYQLENQIAELLAKDFLQNPQVSVFIKEFTSQRVTVQGYVKRAGIYDFQGQATLLQAISMGGGLDEKANENAVKVVRTVNNRESETKIYNLAAIRLNKAENPILKGGDTVVVEEMLPVTVEGAVIRPGVFYMRGEPTLMQAVSSAGGLNDLASKDDIKVISMAQDKKVTMQYDIRQIRDGKIGDPKILPGDIVVVEQSGVRSFVKDFTSTL